MTAHSIWRPDEGRHVARNSQPRVHPFLLERCEESMQDGATTTLRSLDADIERAKAVLLDLLSRNGGSVSTRRLREQLDSQGIESPQQVIAHLKFPDSSDPLDAFPFRHQGRRFYTPEAFQQLGDVAEDAVESAEASEDGQAEVDAAEPRRRRREEARLSRYVFDALGNLYASDAGPERDYVFDVHHLRPGGDFENVDLLAVHWRSAEIVELVAVEVKLAFTAKLVQQANNYRRFANRVWIAVPVDAALIDAAAVLRELDPLLFEYSVYLGLGILACRRAVGRSYEVGPVQWPRRVELDAVEHAAFLERFRDIFESAGVLAPKDHGKFPKIR